MKINDLTAALTLFEESAAGQAEATETGDYKTGNKCYHNIVAAISFIKEKNQLPNMMEYLNHHSTGVRLWAASYLLAINEKAALKTLREIAGGNGIHSLTAETTMTEWKKGNLKLQTSRKYS